MYLENFTARGEQLKAAYSDPEIKPDRECNALVSILVDVMLRAKAAGLMADELTQQARNIAKDEWFEHDTELRKAVMGE